MCTIAHYKKIMRLSITENYVIFNNEKLCQNLLDRLKLEDVYNERRQLKQYQ